MLHDKGTKTLRELRELTRAGVPEREDALKVTAKPYQAEACQTDDIYDMRPLTPQRCGRAWRWPRFVRRRPTKCTTTISGGGRPSRSCRWPTGTILPPRTITEQP